MKVLKSLLALLIAFTLTAAFACGGHTDDSSSSPADSSTPSGDKTDEIDELLRVLTTSSMDMFRISGKMERKETEESLFNHTTTTTDTLAGRVDTETMTADLMVTSQTRQDASAADTSYEYTFLRNGKLFTCTSDEPIETFDGDLRVAAPATEADMPAFSTDDLLDFAVSVPRANYTLIALADLTGYAELDDRTLKVDACAVIAKAALDISAEIKKFEETDTVRSVFENPVISAYIACMTDAFTVSQLEGLFSSYGLTVAAAEGDTPYSYFVKVVLSDEFAAMLAEAGELPPETKFADITLGQLLATEDSTFEEARDSLASQVAALAVTGTMFAQVTYTLNSANNISKQNISVATGSILQGTDVTANIDIDYTVLNLGFKDLSAATVVEEFNVFDNDTATFSVYSTEFTRVYEKWKSKHPQGSEITDEAKNELLASTANAVVQVEVVFEPAVAVTAVSLLAPAENTDLYNIQFTVKEALTFENAGLFDTFDYVAENGWTYSVYVMLSTSAGEVYCTVAVTCYEYGFYFEDVYEQVGSVQVVRTAYADYMAD